MKAFAAERHIPVLALKKPDRSRWDDRKLDHVRPYLDAAEAKGRPGVVAIVAAQEFQWVFTAKNRSPKPGVVSFDFVKEERRVGVYYFYIYDADFGPGFIKICTYFPYPAKVWLLRRFRHKSHYASVRIMPSTPPSAPAPLIRASRPDLFWPRSS